MNRNNTSEAASGLRRAVLVGLGGLCVALGAIGIVVPGLPTTVFLLAASLLFAKGSPRLHRRLLEHPRLGIYLSMARDRRMPLRAKLVTVALMWSGIAAGCWMTVGQGPTLPTVMALCGLTGSGVILFGLRHAPSPAALTSPSSL